MGDSATWGQAPSGSWERCGARSNALRPATRRRRNRTIWCTETFWPFTPVRLWGTDFPYVSVWSGWCYTAFVIDAYARRILGRSIETTMTSQLVVRHRRAGHLHSAARTPQCRGVVAHHDHGSQYLPVSYAEHLDAAAIKPSTGAVGWSFDNALAKSVIGLDKTEQIKPQRPRKGFEDLQLATAEWVNWFNHGRPLAYCDDLAPVKAEQAHRSHHQA